ncbi:MAG: dephospho-CoA kinase [Gemmatimonadaceae bacterium]
MPESTFSDVHTQSALHIGLTGNIASGKSTVARLLVEHGATLIDADVLARAAVAPGTPGLSAVQEYFGDRVLDADGSLNREALRKIVFRDPVARDALNQIVHPAVRALRDAELATARARGDQIIISDIPLLFETGLEHSVHAVVFVDAPEETRFRRLVELRGLPEADARAMMSAQWPAATKRERSMFVIDNDGSVEQLTDRVSDLWDKLLALANSR